MIQQTQSAAASAAMYSNFTVPTTTATSFVLPSPGALSPYMSSFSFPGNFPGISTAQSNTSNSGANTLPGFHSLRPSLPPTLPSYLSPSAQARTTATQPSAYDTIYSGQEQQQTVVTCQK